VKSVSFALRYVFTVLSQVLYLSSDPSKSFGARHFSPLPLVGAVSAITCSGSVGFWGSTGSVSIGVPGNSGVSWSGSSNTLSLNLSTIWVLSSVGVIPNADKSMGSNAAGSMTGANNDIGDDNCVLWVLEIAGDPPLGVVRLLKGECRGLSPVIRCLDVVGTGVDDPVTGVCDAGGLLPSSALSYCSSPDVKVSCLICSCSDSDSELSGALNVRLAPLWAAVVTFYRRRRFVFFWLSLSVGFFLNEFVNELF
jgi:hypothetical protein